MQYDSRYGLLAQFSLELADCAMALGLTVNQGPVEPAHDALALIFNVLEHRVVDALRADIQRRAHGGRTVPLVHWLVDHPLSYDSRTWGSFVPIEHYTLATVCDDDQQLLAMRWPGARVLRLPHALHPSAVMPEAKVGPSQASRDIDVLLAGSIASEAEIAEDLRHVPATVRRHLADMVELRCAQPHLSFPQVAEVCLPSQQGLWGEWDILATCHRYVTSAVNRRRRLAIAGELARRGVRATVLGNDQWAPHCTGSVRYGGQIAYGQMCAWHMRAKVNLALNPTQFVLGWSERLLLGLGAGSATVTDDRPAVRRDFGGSALVASFEALRTFDIRSPQQAADQCEQLLADEPARVHMGRAGAREVWAKHLWVHRLGVLVNYAQAYIDRGAGCASGGMVAK